MPAGAIRCATRQEDQRLHVAPGRPREPGAGDGAGGVGPVPQGGVPRGRRRQGLVDERAERRGDRHARGAHGDLRPDRGDDRPPDRVRPQGGGCGAPGRTGGDDPVRLPGRRVPPGGRAVVGRLLGPRPRRGKRDRSLPVRRGRWRDGDGLRRGGYVLPNLITSGSLFAGFHSIASTYNGNFEKAAIGIVVGAILDGLDGRVARMTHTTTKFGVEYDSLADLVTFGVAPAFLVYGWALSRFGRWGWLAAFLYLICGALRLARFNVQVSTVEKGQFKGLPIPAAATFVASMILLFYYFGGSGGFKHVGVMMAIYVLAFLMVSPVKFNSFKDLEPFRRRPFNTLVVFIFLALLMAAEPQVMIFLFVSAYILSGPVGELVRAVRGRRRKTRESEKDVHGHDAHGEDPREARGEGKG